jgi:folate-dependent phosphoribosylglycinamide formyltransferase PurN
MKWVAFYSQTGSEICDISDKIGRYPDIVVTDNVYGKPKTDNRIMNAKSLFSRQYRSLSPQEKEDYYSCYDSVNEGDLITLHGWLNIVPESVCNKYEIYNGHPGLINYYPELKGKDPVDKVWARISDYLYVGSVIHKVTPEVDGGEILYHEKKLSTCCTSLDETYSNLKETSLRTWVDFFDDRI